MIINNIANTEAYEPGQIIFEEGSPGDWVYVVLSGSVEISRTTQGKKYIIEVLKEGEIFGGMSFLGMQKRATTATAVGHTTVGVVDREPLDEEFNRLSQDLRAVTVATLKRCQKLIDRAYGFTSRKHTRVQRTLSVNYRDGMSFVQAYSANISEGGLFIKTDTPLNQGEEFLLKLQLPGFSSPMNITSQVAWARRQTTDPQTRPLGMGVRFSKISENDRMVLKEFIRDILTGQETQGRNK